MKERRRWRNQGLIGKKETRVGGTHKVTVNEGDREICPYPLKS